MSEYRKLWFYVLKYSFRKGAEKVYATSRSKTSNLEIEDGRVNHQQW
ncbi:hypothetical protein [Bacteriovorax sp. BSW11_IV]|nr:hypothetical protein [Bacteriovorax sp. BSW11_IV]